MQKTCENAASFKQAASSMKGFTSSHEEEVERKPYRDCSLYNCNLFSACNDRRCDVGPFLVSSHVMLYFLLLVEGRFRA